MKVMRFVGGIVDIREEYLNQIEDDCNSFNFHHIELVEIGRHAPINLIVFQVYDGDDTMYFGAEVESWAFDSDCGDDFSFEDIVDDLKPIELVEVKEMKWRFK